MGPLIRNTLNVMSWSGGKAVNTHTRRGESVVFAEGRGRVTQHLWGGLSEIYGFKQEKGGRDGAKRNGGKEGIKGKRGIGEVNLQLGGGGQGGGGEEQHAPKRKGGKEGYSEDSAMQKGGNFDRRKGRERIRADKVFARKGKREITLQK